MEKNKKADINPPVVTVYGAGIDGGIPIYDPRKDDYAAFVKQASTR